MVYNGWTRVALRTRKSPIVKSYALSTGLLVHIPPHRVPRRTNKTNDTKSLDVVGCPAGSAAVDVSMLGGALLQNKHIIFGISFSHLKAI